MPNSEFDYAKTLFLKGFHKFETENYDEAERIFKEVLVLVPDRLSALNNLASTLIKLRKFDEAKLCVERTLDLYPDDHVSHINKSTLLINDNNFTEAIKFLNNANTLFPHNSLILNNLGLAYSHVFEFTQSIHYFNQAIHYDSNNLQAYYNKINGLISLANYEAAIEDCFIALKIDQEYLDLLDLLIFLLIKTCSWNKISEYTEKYRLNIDKKLSIVSPFHSLILFDDPELHLKVAMDYSSIECPENCSLGPIQTRTPNGLIRIGYFSADFHNHATSFLMVELFELHDKTKFEIYAFSFGPNKSDEMRNRLTTAFTKFIDVSNMSDHEVALLSRKMGIDIAVDLKGYTKDNRAGIFALRCAPIQVSYLGYPGTTGVGYMDYIVADKTVIPEKMQRCYTEKIIYLPHCYQVNDSKRFISSKTFTKQDFGLPENGFIYCCFNNSFKILPPTFDIWMNILKSVENSVLWLIDDNPTATGNLKKEASIRGVSERRLIFSKRINLDDHLARHKLADLFLDTLPYNAHTTSSDALWAGLPVLTCMGNSFASRVAGSLLSALELPELITQTINEYEHAAVALALNSGKLKSIKVKLNANRLTTPLFDTPLFTKYFESAFLEIYQNQLDSVKPKNIYIKSQPTNIDILLATALSFQKNREFENAEFLFKKILLIDAKNIDAFHYLAIINAERLNKNVALDYFLKAIEINSYNPLILYNRGFFYFKLNEPYLAIDDLEKALLINPNDVNIYFLLGNIYYSLKKYKNAILSYKSAINNSSKFSEAYCNLGNVYKTIKEFDKALINYNQAIKIKYNLIDAYCNRGATYIEIKKYSLAIKDLKHVLTFDNHNTDALYNMGCALRCLNKLDDSIHYFNLVIKSDPMNTESYINLSNIYQELNNFKFALNSIMSAIKINPNFNFIKGIYLNIKSRLCEWNDISTEVNILENNIKNNNELIHPFHSLILFDDPELHLKVAMDYSSIECPENCSLGPIQTRTPNGLIRIGYFSADFHNHATSFLMVELFELHDKTKFEIYAFSFGPNKSDEMRNRLTTAFTKFIDVSNMSDHEVALLSRKMGIDIAVDLKGYTKDNRAGIFALRCAPIQVSYLGYPGTTGVGYMDYIVADKTVIPEKMQRCYTEKIIYLPHCYQVNDSKRFISSKTFTKQDFGLPENGFIYCCFNNSFKILPPTFDIWMNILKSVENSVLWLIDDNPTATGNLKKEASIRGVSERRLIFSKRINLDDHLARHKLADLFLDTLPYNAHTTSSDALWAGLPVLTCMGNSFASRVAGSLLSALELPELITQTINEYEHAAVALALNSGKLKSIKVKLNANRLTTPLFDTPLFTKYFESAFLEIYQNQLDSVKPRNLYL